MINEFNTKKKELDEKYDRTSLDEPRSWVPGTKAEKVEADKLEYEVDELTDEHSIAMITEMDNLEQTYLKEYEKVYAKDK